MRAISSARSRSRSAALRMILARSKAETARQVLKPRSAAASASSRSSVPATGCVPISSPVAGLMIGQGLARARAAPLAGDVQQNRLDTWEISPFWAIPETDRPALNAAQAEYKPAIPDPVRLGAAM